MVDWDWGRSMIRKKWRNLQREQSKRFISRIRSSGSTKDWRASTTQRKYEKLAKVILRVIKTQIKIGCKERTSIEPVTMRITLWAPTTTPTAPYGHSKKSAMNFKNKIIAAHKKNCRAIERFFTKITREQLLLRQPQPRVKIAEFC